MTPKFCINCKWVGTNGARNWQTYLCFNPKYGATPNLVTGEIIYPSCLELRASMHSCRIEADWFEEAPPKKPDKIFSQPHPDDLLSQLDSLR